MSKTLASIVVLLMLATSCGLDTYQERCVDGKTYYRRSQDQAWKLLDGAPNHAGLTAIACVPDDTPCKAEVTK